MHEICVSAPGEPCLHEAFLFAAGETRSGSVQLDVYQANGRLSIVTVSDFTSWRRVRDAQESHSKRTLHHVADTVLIVCITREDHCLTVQAHGLALLFFGQAVRLDIEHVAEVEPPLLFGEERGREYRRKYGRYFQDYRRA